MFTWLLPAAWCILICILWWLARGTHEMPIGVILVGYVGSWLPDACSPQTNVGYVVLQCIGGMVVLSAVGLLQDWLRISRRWIWGYLIGCTFIPAVLWLTGVWRGGLFDTLLAACATIYLVSVVSCLAQLGVIIHQRMTHEGV